MNWLLHALKTRFGHVRHADVTLDVAEPEEREYMDLSDNDTMHLDAAIRWVVTYSAVLAAIFAAVVIWKELG